MTAITKGVRIHFKKRDVVEVVKRGSNNIETGMVKTDVGEYSTSFIRNWEKMGFLEVLPKEEVEKDEKPKKKIKNK